ncbi:hypothetical protein QTU61_001298 [Campylobacter lari]|nr:hypothetical protein [Campylobacter lari]
MLNKLPQLFSLLFSYKSNIFDIISKPKQAYTYTKFALELKELYEKENDKTEAAFIILDRVLKFKKENPDDFNDFLKFIQELLTTYENDPKTIKQNIKDLLK